MTVSATSVRNGNFGWRAYALRIVFPPVILGAVAVVLPLPINFAAFVLWLALLASFVRKQLRQQRPPLAVASVLMQVSVIVAIVTSAHLAPVKTTERFLDRTITLPKSRMTLRDLAADPEGSRPEWRPHSVSIHAPDDEKTRVVVFPDTSLTLRQFVGAVESQSSLRHWFSHCGNGSTILWGGDCSFGLHLSARAIFSGAARRNGRSHPSTHRPIPPASPPPSAPDRYHLDRRPAPRAP